MAEVTGARLHADGEAELWAVSGGFFWVDYKHFRDQKLALKDYEDLKERTAFSSRAEEVKQAILNVQATAKAVLNSIQYLNGSKGDTNKESRKRSARGATKQQNRFVDSMLKCAAKNTAAIERTQISRSDAYDVAKDPDGSAEKD
ncbi:hypothetical protein OC861_006708 [Tilletia horrida]|nr:hypothetical protein OC861_006708 [Tilletia horrida]